MYLTELVNMFVIMLCIQYIRRYVYSVNQMFFIYVYLIPYLYGILSYYLYIFIYITLIQCKISTCNAIHILRFHKKILPFLLHTQVPMYIVLGRYVDCLHAWQVLSRLTGKGRKNCGKKTFTSSPCYFSIILHF